MAYNYNDIKVGKEDTVDESPNKYKPNTYVEVIAMTRQKAERMTLITVSLLSIGISVADMLGALDRVSFLKDRIPQITLLLLGAFVAYLVFREAFDVREIGTKFKEFQNAVIDQIKVSHGVQTLSFNKVEDLYRYVAGKLNNATERVEDITWGSRTAFRTPMQQEAYKAYLSAMEKACSSLSLEYREISSLSDSHYYGRSRNLIDKKYQAYNLGYYDIANVSVPLVSYIIVDSREVLGWFYRDPGSASYDKEVYIAITDPHIVRLFKDYFQTLWERSAKLKDGSYVNWELLNKIGEKFH